MRFKIEYSKTKTDRWGHILPSPVMVEFVDDLAEAEEKARVISSKNKKRDVNVFDTEGPEFRDGTIWCVYGFKAGRRIFINQDYFKAIDNPAVMDDWYLTF